MTQVSLYHHDHDGCENHERACAEHLLALTLVEFGGSYWGDVYKTSSLVYYTFKKLKYKLQSGSGFFIYIMTSKLNKRNNVHHFHFTGLTSLLTNSREA
jgi:hypothetical protein